MSLRGHSVMIVESDIGPFIVALQEAIEATGAETLVVRGPSAVAGKLEIFDFSAAVINEEHKAAAAEFDGPTIIYQHEAPGQIVERLRRLLSA